MGPITCKVALEVFIQGSSLGLPAVFQEARRATGNLGSLHRRQALQKLLLFRCCGCWLSHVEMWCGGLAEYIYMQLLHRVCENTLYCTLRILLSACGSVVIDQFYSYSSPVLYCIKADSFEKCKGLQDLSLYSLNPWLLYLLFPLYMNTLVNILFGAVFAWDRLLSYFIGLFSQPDIWARHLNIFLSRIIILLFT